MAGVRRRRELSHGSGRVLLVGLEAARCESLRCHLESHGHRVSTVAGDAEVVQRVRAERPKVVVLGEGVGGRGALDLCRALKGDAATAHVAVVVVARFDDAIDRAVARALGAADYLVRPAALDLARRVDDGLARSDSSTHDLASGALVVDDETSEVRIEGRPVALTSVERALLLALSDGDERVHTRAELRARVWGLEGRGDETRLVDQYVKRLRKKLGRAGEIIQTVRGVGYRFALSAWTHRGRGR